MRDFLNQRRLNPEEEQKVNRGVEIELETFGRLDKNKLRKVSNLPEELIDYLSGGKREIPEYFHFPIKRYVPERRKREERADDYLKMLADIIRIYRKTFVGIWKSTYLMNGGGPLDGSQDVTAFPGKLRALVPTIDAAAWIETHHQFTNTYGQTLVEHKLTWLPPSMDQELCIVNIWDKTFETYISELDPSISLDSQGTAADMAPPTSPPTASEVAHPTREDQQVASDSQETKVARQGITKGELDFANENDINFAELKKATTALLGDFLCKLEAVKADSFPAAAAAAGGEGRAGLLFEPGPSAECLPLQETATFLLDALGLASSRSGDESSLRASDEGRKPPYLQHLPPRARYEQDQQLQQRSFEPGLSGEQPPGAGGQDLANYLPRQMATFVPGDPIQPHHVSPAAAAAGVAASASSRGSGDESSLLASDEGRKPPYLQHLPPRARYEQDQQLQQRSFEPGLSGEQPPGAGGQDLANYLPRQMATFVPGDPIQPHHVSPAAAAAGVAASASSRGSGDESSLLASDEDRKPPYLPHLSPRARYEQDQQLQQWNYGRLTPPYLQTPPTEATFPRYVDAGFGSHANNSAGAHNGRRHHYDYDYMPAQSNRGYDVPMYATAFRQPHYRITEPHDEHTQERIQRSYSDRARRAAVGYKRNHSGSRTDVPHNEYSYHDRAPSNDQRHERNSDHFPCSISLRTTHR